MVRSSLLEQSSVPSSILPIKHLIAAAQEKRREPSLQSSTHDSALPSTVLSDPVVQRLSPVPAKGTQSLLSVSCTVMHTKDLFANRTSTYPQVDPEPEEGNVGSGLRVPGSSSGNTEASVIRDAFEGMVETLTRTKESIGRATRLAIDCAKYDLTNETQGIRSGVIPYTNISSALRRILHEEGPRGLYSSGLFLNLLYYVIYYLRSRKSVVISSKFKDGKMIILERERDHFSQFITEGFTSYCKRKRRDKLEDGTDVMLHFNVIQFPYKLASITMKDW